MTGFIIGAIAGIVSSFLPVNPVAVAIWMEVLHLFGFQGEAEVASTTCYLVGMLTNTTKEAYAPAVSQEIETCLEPSRRYVGDLQVALFIMKSVMLLLIPSLFVLILRSMPIEFQFNIPVSIMLGLPVIIYIAVKSGVKDSLLGLALVGCYFLIKDNLYAAFIIGTGVVILPSIMEGPDTTKEVLPNDAIDIERYKRQFSSEVLIGSACAGFIPILGLGFFSVLTRGINASIITQIEAGSDVNTFTRNILIKHSLECFLAGLFITGTFSGKAGMGMVAKPEHISLVLIISSVIVAAIWQVLLSGASNTIWTQIGKSNRSYRTACFTSACFSLITVMFCGGPTALIAIGIAYVVRNLATNLKIESIIFTLPMIKG